VWAQISTQLLAAIDIVIREAHFDGDRDAWVREALEAQVNQEMARARRKVEENAVATPQPGRRLGFRALPGGCIHPPTARSTTLEAEYCILCGHVTRWLT
jgi:hypothetical protein